MIGRICGIVLLVFFCSLSAEDAFENEPVIEESSTDFAQEGDSGKDIVQEMEEQSWRVILTPKRQTMLISQLNLPIVKITKKMGEPFEKGEVLIKMRSDVILAAYQQALKELDKTIVQLNASKELYESGISSELEYKNAQAEEAKARAAVISAKKSLDDAIVKAPYSGKVESILVEEYSYTRVGEEMMELIDDSELIAKFFVPAKFYPLLEVGKQISITLEQTEQTVPATITSLSAMIDPASSLVRVEATVNNEKKVALPGMVGMAKLIHIEKGSDE